MAVQLLFCEIFLPGFVQYSSWHSCAITVKLFIPSYGLKSIVAVLLQKRTGWDTGSIFKRNLTDFNSEFSFSLTGCLAKAKNPVCSTIYQYLEGEYLVHDILNIKISKKIMRLFNRNKKKSLFRLSPIVKVRRKHEERERPCKGIWANLACSYKEAPTPTQRLT